MNDFMIDDFEMLQREIENLRKVDENTNMQS